MIAVYSGLDTQKIPPNMAKRASLFNCRNMSVAIILVIFLFWYLPKLRNDTGSMFTMFPREWIQRAGSIPAEAELTKFTLVTYNVLNSQFLRPGTYSYVPKDILYLKDRHPMIMVEIQAMKPDIIGMEEVDVEYFHKDLNPSMIALGYKGAIAVDADGTRVGQTLFWKPDKFKLVGREHHLLHELAAPHIKEAREAGTLKAEEERVFRTWLKRRSLVLIAHLQHVTLKTKVIVAAIHITWDVLQLPALQTLQLALALQAMTSMSQRTGTQTMIIAGDFNTPPDFPAYSFINEGFLSDEQKQRIKDITDTGGILTPEIQTQIYSRLKSGNLPGKKTNILSPKDFRKYGRSVLEILPKAFQHKLKLSSAYSSVLGHEPEITSADDFDTRVGIAGVKTYCLDYIWYTHTSLGVAGVLKTPAREDILKHVALPSVHFPSDHLPLKAEFYMKPNT